jgi:hypothetical protein
MTVPLKKHKNTCSSLRGGDCDCGKDNPFDLQIKNFPKDLRNQVQSKLFLENKTLKQLTIELYQGYLKGSSH